MKQNLTNLPKHFVRLNRYFFINSKTGARVHKSKIGKCCVAPEAEELKQEIIQSSRWDLNY